MSTVGRLVLVGAPLGNPGDASTRCRDELRQADIIAAEDTRRLARLARDLGIELPGRVVSYFEGNEVRRTPDLVQAALDGARIALVTDGGMPSVSDPGYRLVRAALDAGVPVTAAPGPSAVTTALALSGLPSDRFCFEGFLSRSGSQRRSRLGALAEEERTLVLFEAPHRLAATLSDLVEAFGPDRPAAVCRELTKLYEEVLRGTASELSAALEGRELRGEVALVIAGSASKDAPEDAASALSAVAELVAAGVGARQASSLVARLTGQPRRALYDAAVAERRLL